MHRLERAFILVSKPMYGSSNARIRLALKVLAFCDFGKKKALTADDLDSLKICLGHDASYMSFDQIACAVIEQELHELKRTHAEQRQAS